LVLFPPLTPLEFKIPGEKNLAIEKENKKAKNNEDRKDSKYIIGPHSNIQFPKHFPNLRHTLLLSSFSYHEF